MKRTKMSKYYIFSRKNRCDIKCVSHSNNENAIYKKCNELNNEANEKGDDILFKVFSKEKLSQNKFLLAMSTLIVSECYCQNK